MKVDDASASVLALLGEREPGATICPSEVARVIVANDETDWHIVMPLVMRRSIRRVLA
ncbi:MAG: DUF3253 domain-containing protein [Sphingomonas sp.]